MSGYTYGWIAVAAAVLFLCVVIVLASPVVIHAHIRKKGKDDDIELDLKALFGLVSYQVHIPTVKFYGRMLRMKEEMTGAGAGFSSKSNNNDEIGWERVTKTIDTVKQIVHLTQHLPSWLKQTLGKVQLREWNWSTAVGTGDAMWTAMATGLVWSAKTTLLGVMSQILQLKTEPHIQVQPDYQKPSFTTEWSCTAKIRLGHILVAGFHLLRRAKKANGGVKAWQNMLSKA
ncbi:DUF2953 domain-containing protein [Paenibacillus sp. NEAU-GSW1]|uniref:DUF2953 domain-containing protein n=1 Tax=Paenibacillus sp. NEAU-GSW1 TaxID=2682486 RepID=UPI0012E16502|nr:DUF2953 domain-containing protein [Paenibacillus sp. NEAU-GSW1]MUT65531.1 DUF2953 domain-containing protein [Paenibacillus sp. NEAU-GSW1]